MALVETLPVYRDCYRLLMSIMDVREQFPKGYRYEFGAELMMTGVKCCEILRWANTDRTNRAQWLQEFLVKFESIYISRMNTGYAASRTATIDTTKLNKPSASTAGASTTKPGNSLGTFVIICLFIIVYMGVSL